jgi:hypothetical protein
MSLTRKVETFLNKKVCSGCGGTKFRLDRFAQERNKKNTCNCGDPHYPHRAGNSVWCTQSKTAPTEQDQLDRYGSGAIQGSERVTYFEEHGKMPEEPEPEIPWDSTEGSKEEPDWL